MFSPIILFLNPSLIFIWLFLQLLLLILLQLRLRNIFFDNFDIFFSGIILSSLDLILFFAPLQSKWFSKKASLKQLT